MPKQIIQGKELSTVELNWKEVFFTNCGMVSANNIEERWKKATGEKLPEASELQASSRRLG